MDSSDFPVSRSPRKELQGPRPPALKVRKDSYKIKKPPVAPQQQQQQQDHDQHQHHQQQQTQPRPPVIIYTVSPKVIHTNPDDFMTLVQRLTGSSSSSSRSSVANSNPFNDDGGAISPAARYATVEKAKSPREKQMLTGDLHIMEEGIEMKDGAVERSKMVPGILSPGPDSLQPIPPNFFSPLMSDPSTVSFLHDLSPVFHGNRNFIEGGAFMPSPSTSVSPRVTSPTSPSIDLFNNFNTGNNFFDF